MNRTGPLSGEARRLLELGSHVDPPTAKQNERMDRALAVLFRAGRAGPESPPGSSLRGGELASAGPRSLDQHAPGLSSAAGRMPNAVHLGPTARGARGWLEPLHHLSGGKLWLSLGALAATAGASFWLGRLSTPAGADSPETSTASTRALALAAPALPATTRAAHAKLRASESVPTSSAAGGSARIEVGETIVAPSPVAPSPVAPLPTGSLVESGGVEERGLPERRVAPARDSLGDGLAADIEQLARAEAALRKGRAANALRVLEQRRVLHLLEQAAALRAIAECELGADVGARGAQGVLERWPGSAFRARIGDACRL